MKKDRRRIIPKNIFLLIILCIVFGWIIFFDMGFEFSSKNATLATNENTPSIFPQFFMENFQTTQFNTEGNVEYKFFGESAKHFQMNPAAPSADDYMNIVKPEVIFFQSSEPPWTLQSKLGKAVQQGDLIHLSGDVRVFQDFENAISTKITTDELSLKPREQFAETAKPVMIDYPRAHYEGLGMEVDFAKKLFTLHSDVKGVHEPPQQ
ncbi:MAG: LPS export ABC transporter periplasmic protein LptC [Cellvibrionaceae bacterium]